jgi:hypothetical protein
MKNKLIFSFIKSQKRHIGIGGALFLVLLMGLILIPSVSMVKAFEVYKDNDWKIRFDNNLKYSMGIRVADPRNDREYFNPFAPPLCVDDGDRNFSQGSLISNRFDLLSEFDAQWHRFWGIRLSAAGWVDTVYLTKNDNDSWATFNGFGDHREFLSGTQDVHGLNGELLDAFAYGQFNLCLFGDRESSFSFRIGRHSLQWGESLFFGGNGIAHGMDPTDVVKLLSVPSTQFKEMIMPIARFSWALQVLPNVTIAAFNNFEWRRDRLPAVGSYFSSIDLLDAGGRRLLLAPNLPPGLTYPWGTNYGPALWRSKDMGGGHSTGGFGQLDFDSWGMNVRFRVPNVDCDWGIYYHRFNETEPQAYAVLGRGVDAENATRGKVGEYFLVFPKHIQMIGASFGTQVGQVNVSGEASVRLNTPLSSHPRTLNLGAPGGIPGFPNDGFADNNHHPKYAVGKTFHADLSATWLPGPGPMVFGKPLWQGGTLLAELGYQCLISIDRNANLMTSEKYLGVPPNTLAPLVPNATVLNPRNDPKHYALGFRAVWEQNYYQVIPGFDLYIPFGLGYNFSGRAPTTVAFNGGADKGGDASVGLRVIYNTATTAQLTYTNYFGSPNWQTIEDRDFVSFSINRTF